MILPADRLAISMEIFFLELTGLLAGTLGAMLGLGGSIVLIPALNELNGVQQHLHQATAMIINFFVVAPATWRHARMHAVDWPVVRAAAPAAMISVLIGVRISELSVFQGPNQTALTALFGAALVLFAVLNVWRLTAIPAPLKQAQTSIRQSHAAWRCALLVGAPTGFIGGLLGIGGGILAVPLQLLFLKLPLRHAIGNSAATICGLSIVGAIGKNYAWTVNTAHDPWLPLCLAGTLLPAVAIGSLAGSYLTHRLPLRVVGTAFVAVLLVSGLRQISHWLL